MSFQITVLKVLAGYPGGLASIADLTRYVSILMSSGSDWSNRMKRLAGNVPQLDIFGSAFVVRQKHGWQITHAGRQFLTELEAPSWALPCSEHRSEVDVSVVPSKQIPKLRLVIDNTRDTSNSANPKKLSA